MVKINLMGSEEEERAPEGLGPESGAEREEAEVLTPVPEEEIEELGPPERRGWLVPLLGALGLLAALVVLWVILQGRGRGTGVQPTVSREVEEAATGAAAESAAVTTPTAPAEEAAAPATTAEQPSVAPPVPERTATPSFANAVIVPTLVAVRHIQQVLRAPLRDVHLGLVSQADGEIVVELLGEDDAQLDAGRRAFLSAFPGAQLKLKTRATREIEGKSYRREIFTVGLPGSSAEAPSSVRYVDKKQLARQLHRLAQAAGLAVRGLSFAPAVEEEQLVKTPVRFKALGRREAIAKFLNDLAASGLNVRITKILLVPADWHRSVRDRLLTLVLEMDLCQPL